MPEEKFDPAKFDPARVPHDWTPPAGDLDENAKVLAGPLKPVTSRTGGKWWVVVLLGLMVLGRIIVSFRK